MGPLNDRKSRGATAQLRKPVDGERWPGGERWAVGGGRAVGGEP